MAVTLLFPCSTAAQQSDSGTQNANQSLDHRDLNNMFSLGYSYDYYVEDIEPWRRLYGEYYRFTGLGPIIGRLNMNRRFDITDFQAEIDAYPELSEKMYAYLNIGVSGGDLFPGFRAGAEVFRTLPEGFEGSLGARYLSFGSDDILIFTGSLSKYWRDWLFTARPYFTPLDSEISTSFTFRARRFFDLPDNYVSLDGGFGFSPDERRIIEGEPEQRLLKSRFLSLRGNYLVHRQVQLFGEVKATDQELPFRDELFRIYTFETGARYRF
ncbi:MAG: YaiO family outer membrane beta-barrel protein [Balneolaceae bacterium]|nr:MAG: YaiO family outer membrane beta-barrel protein [Balneolaceae bacterium]